MLLPILAALSLFLAGVLSPRAAAPAFLVVLFEASLEAHRLMRERRRRELLLRVLERARELKDAGHCERSRELILSAIRYELAARLSQPLDSDLAELSPALPRAWRDLLSSGSEEDLLRAAEALISGESRPRLL